MKRTWMSAVVFREKVRSHVLLLGGEISADEIGHPNRNLFDWEFRVKADMSLVFKLIQVSLPHRPAERF